MKRLTAMFAVALAIVAISAGSAFAGGGCDGYSTQSVSLETQTASTGGGQSTPILPLPESSAN